MSLAAGTLFARDFKIVRPLQQGGMGSVYVVEQVSTGRERALKLMHPFLVRDPKLRQRFEQEAKVGAQIESAHVVEIVGAGVDEGTGIPWLCMELLRGHDLASAVAEQGTMPPDTVLAIFEQLCHALGAAHASSVVHRDLKPENIFLATSRQAGVPFVVKVLDFGIAKVVAEGRKTDTSAIGTPLWMAPEQTVTGGAVSQRTDVWLGGAMPPAGFDAWFARCVAREPGDRYADAREAFRELAPLLGGTAPPPTSRGAAPRAPAAIAVTAPGHDGGSAPMPSLGADPQSGRARVTPAQPTPQAFEKTEVAPPPGDDGGDDDLDAPPAKQPPSKARGLALGVVAAVAIVGGAVFGVQKIFATAEQRAAKVIASAEASVQRREEQRDLADQRKKLGEQRAAIDKIFGKMIPIPAGSFDMGADDLGNDERPVHKATVAAFEIDAVEVVAASYRRCVEADKCSVPRAGARCTYEGKDRLLHPINCVDATQARAFCGWLGKRLPTEDEWEYAARGAAGRQWPWGNGAPTNEACWKRFDKQLKRGDGTCRADERPQDESSFGVKGLGGNVREWTSSAYCPYARRDCTSTMLVVRGGAWTDDDPLATRSAAREHRAPDSSDDSVGFRCAREAL